MLKALIKTLVETTDMTNADIHKFLNANGNPCSKRTVRRHANPLRRTTDEEPKLNDKPKILLFDIETAPMEVYMWSLWQQGVSPDNVIKDWSILTFAYKWLFEPEITSYKVSPKEATEREDASIIHKLWEVLDEAQIVVGHNSAKFDHRKANARFALHGLTPPMPYRMIDTMRVAKNKFALSSYKMDYINKLFKLTQKKGTTFDLWKRCVTGNADALQEMQEYNEVDVVCLEELYLALRPWIPSHPPVALYVESDTSACANCGSIDLDWRGVYPTPAGRYRAFRCKGCGAIGRSRYSDLSKDERKRLVVGAAR